MSYKSIPTQPSHTISYHPIPFPTIPYHFLQSHTISYHPIPFPSIISHTIPTNIFYTYDSLSFPTIPYNFPTSFPIIISHTNLYRPFPSLLSHTISYHPTPYHYVNPNNTISLHLTKYCILSLLSILSHVIRYKNNQFPVYWFRSSYSLLRVRKTRISRRCYDFILFL